MQLQQVGWGRRRLFRCFSCPQKNQDKQKKESLTASCALGWLQQKWHHHQSGSVWEASQLQRPWGFSTLLRDTWTAKGIVRRLCHSSSRSHLTSLKMHSYMWDQDEPETALQTLQCWHRDIHLLEQQTMRQLWD